MPRPNHTPTNPHERQLSAIRLSTAAESGEVGRDLEFLPLRQVMPPQETSIQPWSVRYVHAPWPSERRGGPHRPKAGS